MPATMEGSDNASGSTPLLRITTGNSRRFASGRPGKVILDGIAETGDWTRARAMTVRSGRLVEEVFNVTRAHTLRGFDWGTKLIASSNSLPGRTVLRVVLKALLVHSGAATVKGSSTLFTMRTTLTSLVRASE